MACSCLPISGTAPPCTGNYYKRHQKLRDLQYKNVLIRSITLYRWGDNYLIDSDHGLMALPDEHAGELDAIFPFSQ